MNRYKWWIGLAWIILPALAFAQASGVTADSATQAQGLQVMQSVLDSFSNNESKWIGVTQNAALRLFSLLAVIECWFIGMGMLKRGEDAFGAIVFSVMKMCIVWGIFLWLINDPVTILGAIPKSFQVLGGQASGLGDLNPSQMVTAGINIAVQLASSVPTLTAVANPVIGLITSVTMILIVTAFAVLGFQMFAALMHYYILCAAAPILLCGGALSHTRDWAIKQIQGAVSVGLNIFVIYLVAGVVTSVLPSWKATLSHGNITQLPALLVMLVGALLILFMAFKAPGIASALMSGTSSMSAGEMAGAGLGALSLAVGGSIAAVKGFEAALGGASKALGALGKSGGSGNGSGVPSNGFTTMRDAFGGGGTMSGGGRPGGSSGGSSGASSATTGRDEGANSQEVAQLLGPLGDNLTELPDAAEAGAAGVSASSPTPAGSGASGTNSTSTRSGQTDAQGASTSPKGNAFDAAIGGVSPTGGQFAPNQPSQAHPLDQINDKVGRGISKLREAMPDAQHTGTLNIDHKGAHE